MVKKHLKTLTVPKTWPIKRKGQKFVIRPNPGKSFTYSMPIALIFKNNLKYCKTTKEAKAILLDKEILVDGKRRLDTKYLIGLMDVLSFPIAKEYYRILINTQKKLQLIPIEKKESSLKVVKITGKKVLNKGKIQLNLFDGRNILVKKDNYAVGDSVLIELPGQEIKEHFKLGKGNYAFLISGKHTGEHGKIMDVSEGKEGSVTIKTTKHEFKTSKDSIYLVGKEKPAIKIEIK
jgi:small subunit ribosomal protein S4e